MPAAGPQLADLLKLFPPTDWLRAYEYITADQVPEPYHTLLVHEAHMTVTVEAHHGSLVDVRVLERVHEDDTYARKILLTLQSTGRIVQFGLMRVHFRYCSDDVRDEIVAGNTPLGRILINHDVLRRIEPTAYLRILPGPAMMEWFGMKKLAPVYGRLALIHCNDQPAVELLEIVAP
jgi:chorismate-pyruvate lyase